MTLAKRVSRAKWTMRCALGVLVATALVPEAHAEVARFELRTKAAIGRSGYEKIVGTVRLTVDPRAPHNQIIADIDKAPLNATGRVEFSADVYIIRPIEPRAVNGVGVVDIPNRGYPLILQHMNGAPGRLDFLTDADLGDGSLMRRGFTFIWIGWQFDLPRNGRLIGADLPHAAGIEGIVHADFTPNDAGPVFTVADLAGYLPVDPDGADTVLTVRDGPFGRRTIVDRRAYDLRRNSVTMGDGFERGRTYELSYRSKDPAVSGLGLAAVRDISSWLRYSADSPLRLRYLYGYGVSQSGRFLRTLLYGGFNRDERGRPVLDAAMPVGAGGARLSVNERWAQPNSNGFYQAATFPFSDGRQHDPVSARDEGLLDSDPQVKVFHVNSAFEYWGAGRAAALVHTTPDGTVDIPLPANARLYVFASATHSPGPFPPQTTMGDQPSNFVPFALKGLFLALDQWLRDGIEPPPSRYPRLSDGTLVPIERVAFPDIPGVKPPRGVPSGRQGQTPLPLLVSQVDADGIDRAGVLLPQMAVPLGTYTGWNFRNSSIGGTMELFPFIGSFIPFAATKQQRDVAGDPRLAVGERYASREQYLERVREVTETLVRARYLAEDDRPSILIQAARLWDSITAVPSQR
jgi:hypothetical protein